MVPAPSLPVPDEAVRRWHEVVERRTSLSPSRCSCGCRCADGRSQSAGHLDATGRPRDRERLRPA
jgi:hypothetical protein